MPKDSDSANADSVGGLNLEEATLDQISERAFALWQLVDKTQREIFESNKSEGKLLVNDFSEFLEIDEAVWGWSNHTP